MTWHTGDWMRRLFLPLIYKVFRLGQDRGPRRDRQDKEKDRNQGR